MLSMDTVVAASTAAVVMLLVGYYVAHLILPDQPSSASGLLNMHPWIAVKRIPFGRHWSAIASIRRTREMVISGYENYTKCHRPFVLVQFCLKPLFVIDAEQLGELLRQPEAKVNFAAANLDIAPVQHTLGPELSSGTHVDLIRHQFKKRIPTILDDLDAETKVSLHQYWPAAPQEWSTFKLKPSCGDIVRQATNRVLCGETLCRDRNFLQSVQRYFEAILQAAGAITLCPVMLHPVVVPLIQWRLRRCQQSCLKSTEPIIQQRLDDLRNGNYGSNKEEPNDALQWLLRESIERVEEDPMGLDSELVTLRLVVWNVLSIHTLGMTITTTLLDILDSPQSSEYLAGLREEVSRVFATHNGTWNTEALNSLVRVDSAIRESMRVSPLADVAVKRTILDLSGITLDDGLHIPYGVCIAAPIYGIHHDARFYPDHPERYDAFRFSRPVEQASGGDFHEQPKSLSITTTKIEFLPFGYGKHACPGRFFAAQAMKLLLANILLRYDLELQNGRPPNMRQSQSNVPGDDAEISVRLRNGGEQKSVAGPH